MLGSSEAPAKMGRSISLARMEIDKNVVAAALALAKKCGTELSYAHLNQAIKISEDFIREFYGVKGICTPNGGRFCELKETCS